MTVVNRAKLAVKTATRFTLLANGCRYIFDGPIVDARGQGNTVFQYAFKDSTVYCAKIGPKRVVEHEFEIGESVKKDQFPSVMPVVALVPVPDQQSTDRMALLTPLYPASLERFCGTLRESDLLNTARCTISAIICFQKAELCHGDIQPGNMMLANSQNLIVTIDFGSAVVNDSVAGGGATDFYELGDEFGTVFYDRTCLAVSLAHLKWGAEFVNSEANKDKNTFIEYVQKSSHSVVIDIILKLLDKCLSVENLWDFVVGLPFEEAHSLLRPDRS
mmetsp:Transcript_32979/g.61494  ORF Transcript_32979/g.61494 Transcript_32979/m.61494 type:complete len:275 (-) Transcript_32979:303-1127(-)